MADSRLIDELARRARVTPADAAAVVDALAALAAEGRLGPVHHVVGESARIEPPLSEAFVPTPADVDALIALARSHPLGIDFLLGGHLGTVAVTFKTHAFTVEAARERIWSQR